jgi:hypothetical protein
MIFLVWQRDPGMSNLAKFPTSVSAVRHPRAGFESIPRDLSKTELLRYFTYSENGVVS